MYEIKDINSYCKIDISVILLMDTWYLLMDSWYLLMDTWIYGK